MGRQDNVASSWTICTPDIASEDLTNPMPEKALKTNMVVLSCTKPIAKLQTPSHEKPSTKTHLGDQMSEMRPAVSRNDARVRDWRGEESNGASRRVVSLEIDRIRHDYRRTDNGGTGTLT